MSFGDYDLESVVEEKHPLKGIKKIVSFESMVYRIKDAENEVGRIGYGLATGLACLFLQFYYDLSDREIEERIRYDIACRWFCGFLVDDQTPDHTFFCRFRKSLGTKKIGEIFRAINKKAKEIGHIGEIFSFVDSSTIVTKQATWEERDKAVEDGDDHLNNQNIKNYSADKQARFGCKGKDKYWYGYKRHVNRDMRQGLITTIAVTPANISDAKGLEYICPGGGMVFADKAYCTKLAQNILKANNCHSGAILKNNMHCKNKDKDKWITKVRAPFEDAFSKLAKRARYRGVGKIQLQAFMEAITYNLKRLLAINSPPLFQGA